MQNSGQHLRIELASLDYCTAHLLSTFYSLSFFIKHVNLDDYGVPINQCPSPFLVKSNVIVTNPWHTTSVKEFKRF